MTLKELKEIIHARVTRSEHQEAVRYLYEDDTPIREGEEYSEVKKVDGLEIRVGKPKGKDAVVINELGVAERSKIWEVRPCTNWAVTTCVTRHMPVSLWCKNCHKNYQMGLMGRAFPVRDAHMGGVGD